MERPPDRQHQRRRLEQQNIPDVCAKLTRQPGKKIRAKGLNTRMWSS
jgi:hypothetical protein